MARRKGTPPPATGREDTGPAVAEFLESEDRTISTDARFRRVVATPAQASRFYDDWQPQSGERVELRYGELGVRVMVDAVLKMQAWVRERSNALTLEVQGRFLARRRPGTVEVVDFVPLPSFCQSLAYETEGPDDRRRRFGAAKMRTVAPDDWKPDSTGVYQQLGVFEEHHDLPIDPLAVPIPFHSHYLASDYQEGPSPGDKDHIYHLKWLYAPVTGFNILYSGVTDLQTRVPFDLEPVPRAPGVEFPAINPGDCRLVLPKSQGGASVTIPAGKDGVVLGRAPDVDLRVDHPRVSRRHARVSWSSAGELILEDLSSDNGTSFDGEPVQRKVIDRPGEISLAGQLVRLSF